MITFDAAFPFPPLVSFPARPFDDDDDDEDFPDFELEPPPNPNHPLFFNSSICD